MLLCQSPSRQTDGGADRQRDRQYVSQPVRQKVVLNHTPRFKTTIHPRWLNSQHKLLRLVVCKGFKCPPSWMNNRRVCYFKLVWFPSAIWKFWRWACAMSWSLITIWMHCYERLSMKTQWCAQCVSQSGRKKKSHLFFQLRTNSFNKVKGEKHLNSNKFRHSVTVWAPFWCQPTGGNRPLLCRFGILVTLLAAVLSVPKMRRLTELAVCVLRAGQRLSWRVFRKILVTHAHINLSEIIQIPLVLTLSTLMLRSTTSWSNKWLSQSYLTAFTLVTLSGAVWEQHLFHLQSVWKSDAPHTRLLQNNNRILRVDVRIKLLLFNYSAVSTENHLACWRHTQKQFQKFHEK